AAKVNNISPEAAKRVISGELEAYLNRLSVYLNANQGSNISLVQGCNIFLEVIQSGLSFSPIANHVYVSRLKGTGTSIGYKVTADGEIFQAQRSGAISHLSEPVLVVEGEQFSITVSPDGRHQAQHNISFNGRPKFSLDTFMVGYVYVIYPTGDRELHWISAERMKELRAKSQNPAMYNDESFVQTKVIKHALRKVRKTPFTNQGQIGEAEEESLNAREFEETPIPSTGFENNNEPF